MYQYRREKQKRSKLKLYAIVARSNNGHLHVAFQDGDGIKWSDVKAQFWVYPPTNVIEQWKRRTVKSKDGLVWGISIVRVHSKNCPFEVDWTVKPTRNYNISIKLTEGINSPNNIQ